MTALTFSLDPENDPLAITLAIDFFAVASEEYEFVIELYEKWNVSFSYLLAFDRLSLATESPQTSLMRIVSVTRDRALGSLLIGTITESAKKCQY